MALLYCTDHFLTLSPAQVGSAGCELWGVTEVVDGVAAAPPAVWEDGGEVENILATSAILPRFTHPGH